MAFEVFAYCPRCNQPTPRDPDTGECAGCAAAEHVREHDATGGACCDDAD